MKKNTHNMNRFDYYCMVCLSYLGAWGGIVAILSCIWFSDYRWRLFFTGVFLFCLNGLAEASIRKYKADAVPKPADTEGVKVQESK